MGNDRQIDLPHGNKPKHKVVTAMENADRGMVENPSIFPKLDHPAIQAV